MIISCELLTVTVVVVVLLMGALKPGGDTYRQDRVAGIGGSWALNVTGNSIDRVTRTGKQLRAIWGGIVPALGFEFCIGTLVRDAGYFKL